VEPVTVTGPAAASEPVWVAPYPTLTAPADGSAIMSFSLKAFGAGLPGAYTTKVYSRRQTGGAWTTYTDITALTTPALTGDTPPTSVTAYTYTGAFLHDVGGFRTVSYQIKAEILDGSANVVATGTTPQTSWNY
jgi:hypothetical protein